MSDSDMPITHPHSKALRNERAAIHKLPNELLSEVFVHGFLLSNLHSTRKHITFLNTITATCSLWRSGALATPFLWSRIEYDDKFDDADYSQHRVLTYLSRSRLALLDVHISLTNERINPEEKRNLFQILKGFSDRFESYFLRVDDEDALEIVSPLSGSYKNLKTLDMVLCLWIVDAPPQLMDFGTIAPKLENLRVLSQYSYRIDHIPMQGLIKCQLSCYEGDMQHMLQNVLACRDTVELLAIAPIMIDLDILAEDILIPPVAHNFPRVTTLELMDSIPFSFHRVMSFPNVRSISVNGDGELDRPWTRGEFSAPSPTIPNWPHLLSLHLGEFQMLLEDFRAIIQANPTIVELSCLDCDDTDQIMQALLPLHHNHEDDPDYNNSEGAYAGVSYTLAPDLTLLRIACAGYPCVEFGEVLGQLMKSRPSLRVVTDRASFSLSVVPWEDLMLDDSLRDRLSVEIQLKFNSHKTSNSRV